MSMLFFYCFIAFTGFMIFYFIRKYYKLTFLSRLSRQHEMQLHSHKIDLTNNAPTYYYADFRKCILNKDYCLTSDGVFKIDSQDLNQANFNIAGICEYAIINLEAYYATQDSKALSLFKANLDWLINNAEENEDTVYWYYNYEMGPHSGKWASCISQGMAVSVLVRAYCLYGEQKYLDLAEKGIQPILRPIHESGFKYCYDSFKNFYEESKENTHILNGHIYAILGVYDLYRVTNKSKYIDEFIAAVLDIKINASSFDLGFASTYDANEKIIANNSYHIINSNLIYIIYQITNDSFFLNLYNRWIRVFENRLTRWIAAIHTVLSVVNLKIIYYLRKKGELSSSFEISN